MKILIDIGHPAHLHFFKYAAQQLQIEGHQVKWTGRNKDILVELAAEYEIPIEVFGTARKGLLPLALEQLYRMWRLFFILQQYKPDAVLAIAGCYSSFVAKLSGIPMYLFYDTEHATLNNLIAYPFARCIYVPRCYRKQIYWNHVRYRGFHELAYLHPKYFTPDPSVLKECGLVPGEIFSVVRFVGWGAVHDRGLKGFTEENKRCAVRELSKFGKVFISAEGGLPADLQPYVLQLRKSRIHHLMAYATLVFGESATMCSEGAILGVPGIYVDPVGRGYTDEEQQVYQVVFNFTPDRQREAIEKGSELLRKWTDEQRVAVRSRIIGDKEDVTALICAVAKGTYAVN